MTGMLHGGAPVGDGTWTLTIFVTDLQVERSLRVRGDLHIGGAMIRLVDELGKTVSPSEILTLFIFLFGVKIEGDELFCVKKERKKKKGSLVSRRYLFRRVLKFLLAETMVITAPRNVCLEREKITLSLS